jgi:hypothetical protein
VKHTASAPLRVTAKWHLEAIALLLVHSVVPCKADGGSNSGGGGVPVPVADVEWALASAGVWLYPSYLSALMAMPEVRAGRAA